MNEKSILDTFKLNYEPIKSDRALDRLRAIALRRARARGLVGVKSNGKAVR